MSRGGKKKTETTVNKGTADAEKEIVVNTNSEEKDENVTKKYNKRKRKHSVNILVDVDNTNVTSELSNTISVNKRNKTDQKEAERDETGETREGETKESEEGTKEGGNVVGTVVEIKRLEEIKIQGGDFSGEGNVIDQANVVESNTNETKHVNKSGKEKNVVATKESKQTAGRRKPRKKKTETLKTEALNDNSNQPKDTTVNEISNENFNVTSKAVDDTLKPQGRGRRRRNSVTDGKTKKTDKRTYKGKRKIKKDETDTDVNMKSHEALPNDGSFVRNTTETTKENFNLNHSMDAINNIGGDKNEEAQNVLVVHANENVKRESTKSVNGQELEMDHKGENERVKLTDISNECAHSLQKEVKLELQQKGNHSVEEGYSKGNGKGNEQLELAKKEVIHIEAREAQAVYETKEMKPLEKKDPMAVAQEKVAQVVVQNKATQGEVTQKEVAQDMGTGEVIVQEMVSQEEPTREGVVRNVVSQEMVSQEEPTQEGVVRNVVSQEVPVQEEVTQEKVAQELKTEVIQQEIVNEVERQEEEDILATYLLNESKKDNKQILSELRDTIYNTVNAMNQEGRKEHIQEEKKGEEKINIEGTHRNELEKESSKKEKNKHEDRLNDFPVIEGITSEEMNILNKWFFSNKLKILECFFQNKKLSNHLLYPVFEICPSLKFNKSKVVIFLKHIKEKYETTIKENEKEEKMRIQKSQCYETLLSMLNNDEKNLKEQIYMGRYISLLTNETNLLHVQFYIEYLLEKGGTYEFDMFLEHNGLSHFKYILLNMASKGIMKYHSSLVLAILNSLRKCDISLAHLKSTFIGMTINFIAKNKNDEVKGLDFRTDNQTVIKTAEELVAHWKEVRDKTVKGEIPYKKKLKTDKETSNLSNWSERSNNVADISSDMGSSNNTLLIKGKTEILQNNDVNLKENLMMEKKTGKPVKSNKETTDNNIMLSLLGCINKEHEKKKMRHLEYKKAKLEGKFKKHVAIKNSIESSKKKGIELDINREDLIKLKNETEMKEYNSIQMRKSATTAHDVLQYPPLDVQDSSPMRKMSFDKRPFFKMQKSDGSVDYHPPLYKSDKTTEYNISKNFSNRYSENYKTDYGNNRNDTSPRGIYDTLSLNKMNSGNIRHIKDRNLYNCNVDFGSEHKNDYSHDSRNRNAKYMQEKFAKDELMRTKYNSRHKTGWDNTVLNFDKDTKTYVETGAHVGMKKDLKADAMKFSVVQPLPQSMLPLQELFPLPQLPPLPLPKSIPSSPPGSFDKSVINKNDYDQEVRKNIRNREIRNVSDSYASDEDSRFQTKQFTEDDPFKYPFEDVYEEQNQEYHYNGSDKYSMGSSNNNNNYGERKSIYKKYVGATPYKTNIPIYEKGKDPHLNKNKLNDKRSLHMMPKEIHYPYPAKEITEGSQFNINTNPYKQKINDNRTDFRLQREIPPKHIMYKHAETKETFENWVDRKNGNLSYPSQIVKTGEIAKMDKIITLDLDEYNIGPFIINTDDVTEKTYIVFNKQNFSQNSDSKKDESFNITYAVMNNSMNSPKMQELKKDASPMKHKNGSDSIWNRKTNEEYVSEEMLHPSVPPNINIIDFPFLPFKNFPPPPFIPPPKENVATKNMDNSYFDSKYSYEASKCVTENKGPSFKEHQDKSMDQFVSMFDEDLQKVLRKNVDLTKLLMSKPNVVTQMLKGPQYIMEALNSLTEELKNLKERQ